MSCPHFRLLRPAVWVSAWEECDWHHRASLKGCCGLQRKGCNGRVGQRWPSPSTWNTEGRTSACWWMPGILDTLLFLPVLLSTRHSEPMNYWASVVTLYNLCTLHTLLMPLSVPRTDPAPSQGQGPLIMHCELVQTGWTQKQNNLLLGQWSDTLKIE